MGEISFTSKTNVFLFETTQREGFEAGSGGDNEADRVSFFLFCDRFRRRRSVNGRALREMEKYQATMRAEGTCSVLLLLSAAGDGVNKCAFSSHETWLPSSNFK